MKVIATKGTSSKTYICEVNHTELEKFLNLYYGNMDRLKEGDEINLGTGYDFHSDTKIALQTTEKFIKDNKQVIKGILKGITVSVMAGKDQE